MQLNTRVSNAMKLKKILIAAFSILFNRKVRKYYYVWVKSYLAGRSTVKIKIPWITFEAIRWLDRYLKPNMVAFEYGSGGSTIFFAERVQELVSIEHEENWYSDVTRVLKKAKIKNCEYILQKPEKNKYKSSILYNIKSYTSTAVKNVNFERYVKRIDEYPDSYFDLF